MGAYDTENFSYLNHEKTWLKKAIENNTHILGICLGSQLIADSMGGKAYLANEIEFGFKNLKGYETTRLYAFLAERYLSFWFKKYTVYKEQPWMFIENKPKHSKVET